LKLSHSAPHHRQRGFGLIEILVGVTIGVVGVLVMFQTLAAWTARASSTDSGGDAQITGALAMFSLERDIRLAGIGFGAARPANMGCTVSANFGGTAFNFPLAAVVIAQGANGAPDTVTVLHGNSPALVVGRGYTASSDDSKRVETWRSGFHEGDLVVASSRVALDPAADSTATACALVEITGLAVDPQTLEHRAETNYTNFYDNSVGVARFNPKGGIGVVLAGGSLFNLGPEPRLNRWQVDAAGVLAGTDLLYQGGSFAVAEGVVDLQAQYGVDNNNDQRIGDDEWTDDGPAAWAAPNDWTRVRAIRIALLVRSKQFERDAVTSTEPIWGSATKPGGTKFKMANLGAAKTDANNWSHYRYRVQEQVIPLRNILWGQQE